MSDDRKGKVVLSREVSPGTVIEIMTEPTIKLVADYGEYGTVEMNLHHGAKVRFAVGTKAPTLYQRDLDSIALEGENVVRLDDEE